MTNTKKCVICGKTYKGIGNNPYPIKKQGRCCDKCNIQVILVRLGLNRTDRIEDVFRG